MNKMINIQRTRYVITLNNQIYCGLAGAYEFRNVENIGDASVKTYLSEKKAEAVAKKLATVYPGVKVEKITESFYSYNE
jgi:hypothetical protein